MPQIKVEYVPIDELKPYQNNPRNNANAIAPVAESIKQFGFKVPILLDKNNEIIAGHTRLEAAKSLGMTEVPCIYCGDLSPQQVKAFRLADNKVGEFASWDFDTLNLELDELQDFNMEDFGFDISTDDIFSDETTELEASYETPTEGRIRCPHCGYTDIKKRFTSA